MKKQIKELLNQCIKVYKQWDEANEQRYKDYEQWNKAYEQLDKACRKEYGKDCEIGTKDKKLYIDDKLIN